MLAEGVEGDCQRQPYHCISFISSPKITGAMIAGLARERASWQADIEVSAFQVVAG